MLSVDNCKDCAFCEGHEDSNGNVIWYCGEYTGYIEDKARLENIEECEWAE